MYSVLVDFSGFLMNNVHAGFYFILFLDIAACHGQVLTSLITPLKYFMKPGLSIISFKSSPLFLCLEMSFPLGNQKIFP